MTSIQAKIADVDDLQARRISAAENLLRQDLSAIESFEATIEIIDVEMGKDPEYLTVGKTPLERVIKLLSKLDSIRRRYKKHIWTKALAKLELVSGKVFHEVTQKDSTPNK